MEEKRLKRLEGKARKSQRAQEKTNLDLILKAKKIKDIEDEIKKDK